MVYVCTGKTRGVKKHAVDQAVLRANLGIECDAHAGEWHRQVSLLDVKDIEAMRQQLQGGRKNCNPKSAIQSGYHRHPACDLKIQNPKLLAPGAFGENLGVQGVALSRLGLGSRLRIGATAELVITQIGKVCHTPCAIYAQAGDCIVPRAGLFARVVQGGQIQPRDPIVVVQQVERSLFQAVVLTISDRCSRGEAEDTAGPAVVKLLSDAGAFHVYRQKIVPDETEAIADSLCHYSDGHGIDLVLTVGGTGLSPRDVTPEATRAVVDRLVPGLDEAMRAASAARTPHASLSRGVSGVRRKTLIVNLPGSQKAATENLSVILPALPHGLEKLRGDPRDCDPDRAENI